MKKTGIIISIIIAAFLTYASSAVVRTKTTDICHVYDEAGFPLSFIENLRDQPFATQCYSFALSKAHPTLNVLNMAIDWLVYSVVLAAGFAVIVKKRHQPRLPTPQKKAL